jgi:hypothetical protein
MDGWKRGRLPTALMSDQNLSRRPTLRRDPFLFLGQVMSDRLNSFFPLPPSFGRKSLPLWTLSTFGTGGGLICSLIKQRNVSGYAPCLHLSLSLSFFPQCPPGPLFSLHYHHTLNLLAIFCPASKDSSIFGADRLAPLKTVGDG